MSTSGSSRERWRRWRMHTGPDIFEPFPEDRLMQRCGWGLVAIAGLIISACATVERAPIVDDRVSAAALAAGAIPEAAPHGREVFINNCRQCHSLVNPMSMSDERWSKALVRMSRKAH